MKKKTALFALALLAALMAGCGRGAQDSGGSAPGGTEQSGTEAPEKTEDTDKTASEEGAAGGEGELSYDGFSFADVADREFYFSSGAGGWYTVLYIRTDGSFDGHYRDSDMGDTDEGYPNGTIYYSDFSGRFTEPERIDDLTYRFQIEDIEYPLGFGDEIKDGIHYCYSEAYGLDGAEDLYMYLPGSEIAGLPEAYRSWVGYYDLESVQETELPFYGLYNEKMEEGFSSYVSEHAVEVPDWTGQI